MDALELPAAAASAAEAGQFTLAAALFQQAIACSPAVAQLHEQLAQCHLELDQDALACKSASQAVQLDDQVACSLTAALHGFLLHSCHGNLYIDTVLLARHSCRYCTAGTALI